jgi:hypothetical protein
MPVEIVHNDNLLPPLPVADPELSLALARQSFFALERLIASMPPDSQLLVRDVSAILHLIADAALRGNALS